MGTPTVSAKELQTQIDALGPMPEGGSQARKRHWGRLAMIVGEAYGRANDEPWMQAVQRAFGEFAMLGIARGVYAYVNDDSEVIIRDRRPNGEAEWVPLSQLVFDADEDGVPGVALDLRQLAKLGVTSIPVDRGNFIHYSYPTDEPKA
jgi:hypothetical protein